MNRFNYEMAVDVLIASMWCRDWQRTFEAERDAQLTLLVDYAARTGIAPDVYVREQWKRLQRDINGR